MKIVINTCHGGFNLSQKVIDELGLNYSCPDNEDFNIESDNYNAYRSDPRLITAIEKIGLKNSNGDFAKLKIIEIPDDIDWEIDEYDGVETVHEKHRSWS